MPPQPLTAPAIRRRYALVNFLVWLPSALAMAPMVLLMTSRGLGIGEIGFVMAVYSFVCVALELPTGGLADVLSRRAVLAAAAAFSAAALTWFAFAREVWQFVAVMVLYGTARALSSGPAQAWYVDALHAVEGSDADLKPGLSRGGVAGSVSLCVGMLAGGFVPLAVPRNDLVEPLAVPVLAAVVAAVTLLVTALVAMPEPPRPRATLGAVLRDVPLTVRSGLALGLRDRALSRLLLVAFAFGIALNAIELLTPGRLAALTGRAETGGTVYAVVAALGFAGNGLGSAVAPAVARLLGTSRRAAIAATVVTAAALGGLAASVALSGRPGILAAMAGYVVLFAALSVVSLLRSEMMHHRVGSAQRATLMSVDSLQLQFGGMVAALGIGWLAGQAGTAAAWTAGAVALLLTVLLYPRGLAGETVGSATGSSGAGVAPEIV
ncbi:MFS transporter [Streptosporangium sp. NBC_01639]|uniref:MFS transporter n=1 Tax=Streptosporangium sp. NBC_01639 TaxID=2975948 RepID=UPI003869B25B|nr:MFS transporter [Streptosporangium sp. NBC_01639]